MLALTIDPQHKVFIGPNIVIQNVGFHTMKIGIEAPSDVRILRDDANDTTPKQRELK